MAEYFNKGLGEMIVTEYLIVSQGDRDGIILLLFPIWLEIVAMMTPKCEYITFVILATILQVFSSGAYLSTVSRLN